MGRPRKSRTLSVWMNGERVGDWRRSSIGAHEFLYAESWLASSRARPISLSLPLRPSGRPYREGVEAFFDNLLPDNRRIRERIQRRFQAGSIRAFDLLTEIGRDCVGALQLMPEGESPIDVHRIASEKLSHDDVATLLGRTLGMDHEEEEVSEDPFRISLAGAQEKTALLFRDGGWRLPTQSTPTTHILKLPLGITPNGIDLSTSVENEWLCSQIVRSYGIPTAECRMDQFSEYRTLVVERFDRRLAEDAKWYVRLPQEDFCQATATPPELKYESDGGPGIRKVMELLLGSEQSTVDRADFMRTQVVLWLLAAIDGHAKNFSVFLLPAGSFRLTPRYDILSAYPLLGHGRGKYAPEKIKMAMAVLGKNRHYRWSEIRTRHWLETASRCGFTGMESVLEEIIDLTPQVIRKTQDGLPPDFPPEIAEPILKGLGESVDRLKTDP